MLHIEFCSRKFLLMGWGSARHQVKEVPKIVLVAERNQMQSEREKSIGKNIG